MNRHVWITCINACILVSYELQFTVSLLPYIETTPTTPFTTPTMSAVATVPTTPRTRTFVVDITFYNYSHFSVHLTFVCRVQRDDA